MKRIHYFLCVLVLLFCSQGIYSTNFSSFFSSPNTFNSIDSVSPGVYHIRLLMEIGNRADYAVVKADDWSERFFDNQTLNCLRVRGENDVNYTPICIVRSNTQYPFDKVNSDIYMDVNYTQESGYISIGNVSVRNVATFSVPYKTNSSPSYASIEFDWHMPARFNNTKKNTLSMIFNLATFNYDTPLDSYTTDLLFNDLYGAQEEYKHPESYTPSVAVDMGNGWARPGTIMVPVACGQKILGCKASNAGEWQSNSSQTAFCYVDATDKVQKIKIDTRISYNNDEYLYRNDSTPEFELPAYHKIYNFQVKRHVSEDGWRHGEYDISWKIAHPKEEDILPSDMFEIQRAMKEDFSDAVTIAMIPYETDAVNDGEDSLTYVYMDDSDEAFSHSDVYYRVRRASASAFDWDESIYEAGMGAYFNDPWESDYLMQMLLGVTSYSLETYNSWQEVKKASDWATSRKLIIDVPFVQSREYFEKINHYWWDPNTEVTLYRYECSPVDTAIITIPIPKECITMNYDDDASLGIWRLHYEDIANTPCVNYIYRIEIDSNSYRLQTPSLNSKRLSRDLDQYRQTFYFEDEMEFISSKASRGSFQKYVMLHWSTIGGNFDNYTIKRSLDGTNYTTIGTTQEDFYQDIDAPFNKLLYYRIVGETNCNGTLIKDSTETSGFRAPYGSLSGQITYPDGSGCAGITVTTEIESTTSQLVETHLGSHFDITPIESEYTLAESKHFTYSVMVRKTAETPANITLLSCGHTLEIESSILPENAFATVTQVYDGTTLKLYVDTTLITETAMSDLVSGGKLKVGNGNHVYMDELRIFNRALSKEEVQHQFCSSLTGTEENLVAYFRFDETAELGQEAADRYCYYDGIEYMPTDTNFNKLVSTTPQYSDTIPQHDHRLYQYITTANGQYAIGGLPIAEAGTTYNIIPSTQRLTEFTYMDKKVTAVSAILSGDTPSKENIHIVNTSTSRFSGRVLYEGSTIPVYHARFEVNGLPVIQTNGEPVETDASGNFTLIVPKGTNTIRVVMDHHTFANDGYFQVDGSNEINNDENLDGVRMQDLTKVTLIGRVVGGLDEGTKELGKDLSRNNLGDSITLVFELEGDNISHLVHDFNDLTIKTRDTVFEHQTKGYSTAMHMTTKRITVKPDPVSGEYRVSLYPVSYRIIQASAKGYATLFPSGTTSQVLDLTNSVASSDTILYPDQMHGTMLAFTYNATYNLIYRSPVSVSYKQVKNSRVFNYLGEEKMTYSDLSGNQTQVTIALTDRNQFKGYLFGYPVFKTGQKYTLELTAHEDYYYNNDIHSNKHAQVLLKNKELRIINGMLKTPGNQYVTLNDAGSAYVTLTVDNPTFDKTGTDALRQVGIYVNLDGSYVAAEPLYGFVQGMQNLGKDFMSVLDETDELVDIIRDPYGSGSYAYIDKGTSYNVAYNWDLKIKAGVALGFSWGTKIQQYTGLAVGLGTMAETGVINNIGNTFQFEIPITFGGEFHGAHSYTFSTNERIQTSGETYREGAGSDVYVGYSNALYLLSAEAVTIINDSTWNTMQKQVKNGTIKLLAKHTIDSIPYYLVISHQLMVDMAPRSSFAFPQSHITSTIIPQYIQARNSLLRTGLQADLKAIANQTGKQIYRSLVDATDKYYGLENGVGYEIIQPDPEFQKETVAIDSIEWYNKHLLNWCNLIYANEAIKVKAIQGNQPFQSYSIASGVTRSYSETTSATSGTWNDFSGIGGSFNSSNWLNFFQDNPWAQPALSNLNTVKSLSYGKAKNAGDSLITQVTTDIFGSTFKFSFHPIFDINYSRSGKVANTKTKTIGYVLTSGSVSTEEMTVYRVTENNYNDFNKEIKGWREAADNVSSAEKAGSNQQYADFVFARTAGATRCPYSGADSTIFYSQGGKPVELAAATLKIDNPTITIDRYLQSGVPEDEAAIFVLTLANESEVSDGRKFKLSTAFNLYQDIASNPNGLQIYMDGMPITDGRTFYLAPNDRIQKTIYVYRGNGYDFDDVKLTLKSSCDVNTVNSVRFSVHYTPEATPIHLSLPADNWLMNTLSQKDDNGYYIPVQIDGFDVNSDGFDHIAFQYKRKIDSDADWVTLCNYYADESLYAAASGNKQMIENGKIPAFAFYGERDPMEQNYELRAVSFRRYGNDMLTRSSEIRSGLKDTRCPQIFGNASPKTGILTAGDYISVPYSEDIAANYLDEDNNFEITGYTNKSGITNSIALQFSSKNAGGAISSTPRNLNQQDFTLDLMVMPSSNDKMTYFSHENTESHTADIIFGQNGNNQLFLTVNGQTVYSKPYTSTKSWMRATATYASANGDVRFYIGTEDLTDYNNSNVTSDYAGIGLFIFGGNNMDGKIQEARIWTKVLSQAEIAATNMIRLTGYEQQLLAYYPMHEGQGNLIEDISNGANLTLNGQQWALPETHRSIRINNDEQILISGEFFNTTAQSDMTLSFWFKADESQNSDIVALISSGRGTADEVGAGGHLFIGLEHGNIVLRQNGKEIQATGHYMNGEWHQVALTINHGMNAGALFVDALSCAQFPANEFTGWSADTIRIGQCKWQTSDSIGIHHFDHKFQFNGWVDDVLLWEQALPTNYLEEFYHHAPNGDEMGLACYIPFSEEKLNSNQIYETVPCRFNSRITIDESGQQIPRKPSDIVIFNNDDELAKMLSNESAPFGDRGDIKKMNFSWIGKDNELVINLKMLDKEINKQNIFITIRDVEDLAGNPMKSPASWTIFVDKNSLRWSEKYVQSVVSQGETATIHVDIKNNSGTTMNYKIEDLPWWLTTAQLQGNLEPTAVRPITFVIDEHLDPGQYSDQIYLTDVNGLSEALDINVEVKSEEPTWAADKFNNLGETMTLFGQVHIIDYNNGDTVAIYDDIDEQDIVGAFVNGMCIGRQNITYSNNQSALYMTLYGNSKHGAYYTEGEEITFQLWRAKSGKIFTLTPDTIEYKRNKTLGSPTHPIHLYTTTSAIQQVPLQSGWNWTSFYIEPSCRDTLKGCFMPDFQFSNGDAIKSSNQYSSFIAGQGWAGTLTKLDNQRSFLIHVANSGTVSILGKMLNDDQRVVHLNAGWNYLPYLCSQSMPIKDAMADYLNEAQPGDILKNYTEFAMMTEDFHWVGSLTHMQPGVGYMLYRTKTSSTSFRYIDYLNMSDSKARVRENAMDFEARAAFCTTPQNMPLLLAINTADNQSAKAGDILQIFANGKLAGEAKADENGLFYMLAYANENDQLSFVLNGKQIAEQTASFTSNGHLGTPEKPYLIDFSSINAAAVATPNPFSDFLRIMLTTKPGDEIKVTIFSPLGMPIAHEDAIATNRIYTFTLNNTTNLPAGLYLAQITIGNQQYNLKLIHND